MYSDRRVRVSKPKISKVYDRNPSSRTRRMMAIMAKKEEMEKKRKMSQARDEEDRQKVFKDRIRRYLNGGR